MRVNKPTLVVTGVLGLTVAAALFNEFSLNRQGIVIETTPTTISTTTELVTVTDTTSEEPVFTVKNIGKPIVSHSNLSIQSAGKISLWVWPAAPNGFRLNVSLNTNSYLNEAVWESSEWREQMCPEGRVPIKVWLLRNGTIGWKRAYTVSDGYVGVKSFKASLPCERLGYTQIATAQFKLGPNEQFGVEYSPAIMAVDHVMPFGSLIDNKSNDPTTVSAILVRVDELIEVSTPR